MSRKPDYYVHQHTRTLKVPNGEGKPGKKVKRHSGEHVMTMRIFRSLKFDDVIRLLNGGRS